MRDEAADLSNHTILDRPAGRTLIGVVLRICVPALLWTVVAIAGPVFISQIRRSDRAIQEDFAVYYFSAYEMRRGINPYTTNFAQTARASGFNIHAIALSTDPPTFVAAFAPLTRLPLRTAYLFWQTINFACMVTAIIVLIGPGSGLRIPTAFTLGALFVLYPPVASHFWFGQSKFPVLLLFVVMMWSMKHRRDAIAGSALALATLMHVFPIVMTGYLLLTRKWRVLGWTIATIVFGAAVTVAFVGWRNCIDFILAIPSISNVSWNMIQRDLAAQVFLSRQLHLLIAHPGLAFDRVRLVLNLAVDLLILTATMLATLALPEREDPDSRIFALWVATAVFLLPVAWDYDLILMLIPFSQLAVVAARGEASRRAIAMAVASYALLFWWEYVALSANEFGFFAMLTAWLSAYWLAVDQPGVVRLPIRSMPSELWRRLTPAT
jgi:hypothetical protein